MPLTAKGNKIMGNMAKEYGPKKGEQVFYASRNKGTISGVERMKKARGGPAEDFDETYPAGKGKLDWTKKYRPKKRASTPEEDAEEAERNVSSMENAVRGFQGQKRGGRAEVGKAHGGAAKKRADR